MSPDTETEGARGRDLIVADIVARTGIDEAMIERLVRTFYGRARRDPLLGHVLEEGDWSLLDPVRARPPMWRRP